MTDVLQTILPVQENNNASLIQAKEELINHWQSVEMQKKTSWFDSETPLQTCLRNPYEFFHFENKMVIGDISKVKYLSGLIATSFHYTEASPLALI